MSASASHSPDEKQPSGTPPANAPKPATDQPSTSPRMPAAGPHAAPHLTNPDATPGTGVLPSAEQEEQEGEADAGTG